MKEFNVLLYDWNCNKAKYYNILPYFRTEWQESNPDVKTKGDLKKWILRKSQYQFWARCEYEIVISHWPLNTNSVEHFYNDMHKIDVDFQIKMNIDIITDILFEEFNI